MNCFLQFIMLGEGQDGKEQWKVKDPEKAKLPLYLEEGDIVMT